MSLILSGWGYGIAVDASGYRVAVKHVAAATWTGIGRLA
jgi:hypothetical protein